MRSCHRARAFSTSSPALPELSSQTSATARRCSSEAWAAMRARASSSVKPRYSISRLTRRSGSACTITTSGNIGAIWDSTSSGMSSTMTASACAASISSERRCATSGCTMPLRVARFSSSLNAMAASAGRFSAPSSDRMPSPNASTRRVSPSVPGSTTSRAITSPSTTMPPSSLNVADTVDLPAPIPPVNPMRSTGSVCQAPSPDDEGPGSNRARASVRVSNYALPASFSRSAASWASLASDPPPDDSSEREVPLDAGRAASSASAAANFSIWAVCIL